MIHQLLELSALEAQSHLENSHQFNLAACGRRQISQLTSLAESSGVTLESDIPENLPFFGNEPLLGSAITHLLENGIQFSPKQGIVLLSAAIHDDRIILLVRDQGNGIPDFAAKKAFERFYSFRSEERGKGNGLGLTFVQEVAELHQGKARISRLKEGGTEAAMELPMSLTST
jgi:two-component system sensor histidine kinase CreC